MAGIGKHAGALGIVSLGLPVSSSDGQAIAAEMDKRAVPGESMQVQAYATTAAKQPLQPWSFDLKEFGPNEVDVHVTHCGICHTDVALVDNKWGISQYPVVPGHEIVGAVATIGSAVTRLQVGQRVGVGALCGSCMQCEWCEGGAQHVCAQVVGTVMGNTKEALRPSFVSTTGSSLTPTGKDRL